MTKPAPETELKSALQASKRLFLHVAAFSFFINLLMLTGPLYMLQVYDRVLASQSMPTLWALTLLILALYGTLALLEWVRTGLFGASGARFEELLSERAADASLTLSLRDAGKSTDRPLRDLRSLRRFLAGPALAVLFDAPWSPLFFAVLFMLHPYFGLFALVGAAILTAIGFFNQRATTERVKAAEDLDRDQQVRSAEMVRNAEVMEALGMRANVRARWRERFSESDVAMTRSGDVLATFTSGTKAFRLFLQSAILGLGAWLVIDEQVSGGAMIASSILMGRAIAPIEQAVGMWRQTVVAREAWVSLTKVFTSVPALARRMSLPPIKGALVLENVYAAPAGANKPTLRGLNIKLEPGDVLGILGPSAAGKTTLAKVVTGIWPPLSGHVRLDGADLSSYASEELGAQMGYLPQQVDLLSGSVRDNIARFSADATDAEVIEAAQAAGCHEIIMRLPQNYMTEAGAGGAYLSAGQRQRVGLARALFRNPNFVVLDEPNANLDQQGDTALQTAIQSLKARGATVIIVAHRPAAIEQCNKLIVLDNGEIKLFGPAAEVLAKIRPGAPASIVRGTARIGDGNA